MRRFYRHVEVAEAEDGVALLLDGKPVKTPAGHRLCAPSRVVAEAAAEEWEVQREDIVPAEMPVTRFVNSVIDGVRMRQCDVAEAIVSYGATDLLCYRTPSAEDAELASAQRRLWDPPLDWIAEAERIRLAVTEGLQPAKQNADAIARLRALVGEFDAWRLAGVHTAATVTGSAVLALALDREAFSPERIWRAATLEESHQIARWGDDAETAKRRDALRRELEEAAAWLTLLD